MSKFNQDEILASLEGIERAEAPPFLQTRIWAALHYKEYMMPKWVPTFAITLLLGILISNIVLYKKDQHLSPENTTSTQQFLQTYHLPSTPTLYEQDLEQ